MIAKDKHSSLFSHLISNEGNTIAILAAESTPI
jgi:hypothetical protein